MSVRIGFDSQIFPYPRAFRRPPLSFPSWNPLGRGRGLVTIQERVDIELRFKTRRFSLRFVSSRSATTPSGTRDSAGWSAEMRGPCLHLHSREPPSSTSRCLYSRWLPSCFAKSVQHRGEGGRDDDSGNWKSVFRHWYLPSTTSRNLLEGWKQGRIPVTRIRTPAWKRSVSYVCKSTPRKYLRIEFWELFGPSGPVRPADKFYRFWVPSKSRSLG